ncbi:MAG: molybdopterin molybdotransferase MoeA [Nitrososphaerota archaeon]|nr:molybdopterin molybdotransferase MoeA [Nitrososphaerota archaeon]
MVFEISQYLSVREALSHALAELGQPVPETVPVKRAFGRVAAANVVSSADVPAFSTSHRDGFAIRAEDSAGATEAKPSRFTLVGNIPLGRRPTKGLGKGEAVRVATGSFIPTGADAVVQVEDAKVVGGRLQVTREVPLGSYVFGAGEDVRKGKVVVKSGEVLRAQDVGMLVALAVREVKVWKKPMVAILATGNELTNSMSPSTNKTRNSHALVFVSMARALGCDVVDLGIAKDKVGVILGRLSRGLREADIVMMTGGTSVGKLDLADDVLSRLRPKVLCHGLRMDRGRVAGLAVVKGRGVVMMPGPIQGAMNAFILLGLPMIEKLSGRSAVRMTMGAKLTRRWEARKKFPNFTKVVYLRVFQSRTGVAAEPLAGETESMTLLTDSNAYAVIPEEITSLEAGREIDAHLLPGFSFV